MRELAGMVNLNEKELAMNRLTMVPLVAALASVAVPGTALARGGGHGGGGGHFGGGGHYGGGGHCKFCDGDSSGNHARIDCYDDRGD